MFDAGILVCLAIPVALLYGFSRQNPPPRNPNYNAIIGALRGVLGLVALVTVILGHRPARTWMGTVAGRHAVVAIAPEPPGRTRPVAVPHPGRVAPEPVRTRQARRIG